MKISRDPDIASKETYDLVIIGGGVYGCMLSLESSRRGLRSLLVEREDFGGSTSFNSLRIIHGGFRYLQDLDFQRLQESIEERQFFLQNFPDLVKILPCLMPLYGDGLRRPWILAIGSLIYNFLLLRKNRKLDRNCSIPSVKVLSTKKTRKVYNDVILQGLKGAVVWFDGFVEDSHRLLIEVLRMSAEHGGKHLNYVMAINLLEKSGSVVGIRATDMISNISYNYRAPVIINASGPWCRQIAKKFDRDIPKLFHSTLSWNVLLEKKPFSKYALAQAPKESKGQTYFLVPWKGKLLAGTGHAPWDKKENRPWPSAKQLQAFIDNLNLAFSELSITRNDISYVFPGQQPAIKPGGVKLANREVIVDHSEHDGPKGLYSISGVKFTTARLVAEKTLKVAFPHSNVNAHSYSFTHQTDLPRKQNRNHFNPVENDQQLTTIIQEESVVHLDDLVFRRTSLWEDPEEVIKFAKHLCKLFPWDQKRESQEIKRLRNLIIQKGIPDQLLCHE